MSKVSIVAHVPPALLKALYQHIREFDVAHPGCAFEILVNAPEQTVDEAIAALEPEATKQ
jgi:hypothetical protein